MEYQIKTARGVLWIVRHAERYGIAPKRSDAERLALAGSPIAELGIPDGLCVPGRIATEHAPIWLAGANSYLREHLPFEAFHNWDIRLMKTSKGVLAVAFNFWFEPVAPVWVFCEGKDALTKVIHRLVLELGIAEHATEHATKAIEPKLLVWYRLWISKLPWMSIKEYLTNPV